MQPVGACFAALPVSVKGENESDGVFGERTGWVIVGGGIWLSAGSELDEFDELEGVALEELPGGLVMVTPNAGGVLVDGPGASGRRALPQPARTTPKPAAATTTATPRIPTMTPNG